MNSTHPTRILVVTDHAEPGTALLEAMRSRTMEEQVQFRVVVLNPARAELHLSHPERHDKAAEAEQVLHEALFALELAAGGRVLGSVSVRHDPMDAIEETLFSEPVDEIFLSLAPHGFSTRLHQDLAHRLKHFEIPVTAVPPDSAGT